MLDFAVDGEPGYYTLESEEATDWKIDDETRFILYPDGEYFTCLIESNAEPAGRACCWCE